MTSIRACFEVAFRYEVHFTERVLDPGNPLLASVLAAGREPTRALAVVDAGVAARHVDLLPSLSAYARAHAAALTWAGPAVIVPGGASAKGDRSHLDALWALIDGARLGRDSALVAIGGGAVLDLAGFAAATARVPLVRVPTTVLAMCHAGVGVRNGLDWLGKKDLLAVYAPPLAVVQDHHFLVTLDVRDRRAGTAEAVRTALTLDVPFFTWIEAHATALAQGDPGDLRALIRRCATLRVGHATADPFERRGAALGEWAARQLLCRTEGALRHGEAVAIGLALDATYARLAGILSESAWSRVIALLGALGLPRYHPALEHHLEDPDHPHALVAALAHETSMPLLRDVGRPVEVQGLEADRVRMSVRLLREYARPGPNGR